MTTELTKFERDFGLKLNKKGEIVVGSITIADKYGKRHDNVVTKIKGFIELIPELSDLNFKVANYLDEQGKPRPCYEMDRQGFAMLVNKFTGDKATIFTYQYTKAFEEMAKEIERLKTDNKDLYNIAISDNEQADREYKAKVKRYAIKNLRNVLNECTYKNIEDTVFDIVDFHENMSKKDRYVFHQKKNKTQYKQHIRKYLSELLDNIYNECNNGDLKVIALRLEKDVMEDRLKTTNRSGGKTISHLRNKYSKDMLQMGLNTVELVNAL